MSRWAGRPAAALWWLALAVALATAVWTFWRAQTAPAVLELRWQTENELDLLGFNLYRAAGDEEPIRLNAALIPARAGLLGGDYTYRDEHAQRGRAYSYWIELVYRDGRVQRLPQPIALTAR